MLVIGEIKCLHCGHASGQWVGEGGTPLVLSGFRPPEGKPAPEGDPGSLVRCSRCDGSVFLNEATAVINSTRLRRIKRLREQIAAIDARQRRSAA
jgi:hypothetical protein